MSTGHVIHLREVVFENDSMIIEDFVQQGGENEEVVPKAKGK